MIEIKRLNKTSLHSYVHSSAFQTSAVLPISYHRAMSQILNPAVKDEDILLLLTYFDDILVGYLGVLPDDIYHENELPTHIGWMSCLWVDPNHRGKKIAQNLIHACFEAWSGKILLTEFTPDAARLYEKMGLFQHFYSNIGKRWYIRSSMVYIFPLKWEMFKRQLKILNLIDSSINYFFQIIQIFKKSQKLNYKIEILSNIDTEVCKLITDSFKHQTFRRDCASLDWIIQNPWIIKSPLKDDMAKKYHFTSSEKQFETKPIKILNKSGKLTACIVITIRNGHLRMPYCFHSGDLECIREVLNYFIILDKVHTCTIYNKEVNEHFVQHKLVNCFSKNVVRTYLISKSLFETIKILDPNIQDGDGDCAFT
ncbi:MAG: GNAT family N-acetyltransferase [Saprospiraceae bacterium]|nr:GNAT family N-acetyltransferase [Saprospiraceae bacterium]